MRTRAVLPVLFAVALLAPLASAEPPVAPRGGPPGAGGPPHPEGPVTGSGVAAADRTAIAWYGTWTGALAEAARSGRPILLMSAAPQCHGISGLW